MAYTTIDDPTIYFNTKLYTGNGSTNALTGVGFQPDWVWTKGRGDTYSHMLYDSVRGATKELNSHLTDAETTVTNSLTSFNSDGFTLGSFGESNDNSQSYVAWCWKANGSGSSNTNGTINTTSTSANTTAGFSINTYVGNATSNQTIGHGLGAVPHMIISKNRDNTSTHYNDWMIYHHSNATANDKKLKLNTSDAVSTTNEWGDTDPTSTVYSVHTSGDGATNDGTDKIVSYVFTGIQGFSKFGSYIGNSSSDGSYIYLGFRPAFIMIKRTNGTQWWIMKDNKRDGVGGGNPNKYLLYPNASDAEETNSNAMDFLSNGFKFRESTSGGNNSGGTYIYAAFAESSFVNSKGVPCNAR